MALKLVASAALPTRFAAFKVHAFRDDEKQEEYFALTLGDQHFEMMREDGVLVRIHSSCTTGEALSSLRCDCGAQLALALEKIAEEGRGLVVYMRQEGRGIGLLEKIRAYELQDNGMDTVDANIALGFASDQREYSAAAEICLHFRIESLRLMTNNPHKVAALEALGLKVVERIPHRTGHNPHNEGYLKTKAEKLGHLL